MEELHFVQSHSKHIFSEEDKTDYSSRDKYFIQSLKAMENIMDIDAYIIDYKNEQILYITKDSSLSPRLDKNGIYKFNYLDNIIYREDMELLSVINYEVMDFLYSLPIKRRLNGCYTTHNFRIVIENNKSILINHKVTILDLTENGAVRLGLCVINSFPTSDKAGNAYIKMTDTNTVYEFIPSSQKFVEVKTQRLTSKTDMIVKLASNGKTEAQIAKELGISINTVKYHKKRIFAQTGVKNMAEAIQWVNNQKKMVKGR